MEINKKSPIPIYFQLKQIILNRIKKGEWLPDSPISSERELSEMFGVSRMTIRQALNELVSEGILYREKGRGTFVREQRIEQSDAMSFTEAALNQGLEACNIVKNFEIEVADMSVMERLGLDNYEDVYYIQRFRAIEKMIIGVEEMYIPVKYIGNIKKDDFKGSVYKLLKDKYDYSIDHVKTTLEAVITGPDELKLFNLKEPAPILKVTAVHVTDKGLNLYYEESLYRSDKYVFNVNIYRR